MEYQLQRIWETLQVTLYDRSAAQSFMASVQSPGGEILLSSDRIRFVADNRIFRFQNETAADRMMGLLEGHFEGKSEALKLTRQS